MQNKIKISLLLLVLIALFSVFSFFNSLGDKTLPSLMGNLGDSLLPPVEEDADHDGLKNTEESYWNTDFQNPDTDGDGFLDGEETISGHDPLKPGPDDILSSGNITESLADLITAGVYTQDLKPGIDDNKYDRAVSDLSFYILDNFYKAQIIPDVSPVLISNSTGNQKKYLESVAIIIKDNLLDFPQKINLNQSIEQQSEFFINKGQQYKKSYDDLSKMPVPKDWESIHKVILNILSRLAVNYAFIGSYDIDPLKSVLAMDEIQKNIEPEIKILLGEIQSKIKQSNLNLNLDNNIYDILNLIYK